MSDQNQKDPIIDRMDLFDEQTREFIRQTESYYPEELLTNSIEDQRMAYDKMCRAFHRGYPEAIQSSDNMIQVSDRMLPIRSYAKEYQDVRALVVYYHGGGFVVGGLESHDDICAEICDRTGYTVVSVDYRLAPEHRFPDCFNDALASFEYLAGSYDVPVVIAGDSAGGNLAAAVCEATKHRSITPIGQLLIYPSLGPSEETHSFRNHANAPLLTSVDCKYYHRIRGGGEDWSSDPRHSPLAATDYSNLPPTVVFSAEVDPLCDDGQLYVRAIKAAGGMAYWYREEGLPHGYLRARRTVQRARDSFNRIVQSLTMLGNSKWSLE